MPFKIIMGIYQIKNKINNKVYVGSSCNISERWNKHKKSLLKNKHHNKHLQNAVNFYGIENFIFEILEIISKKEKDIFITKETEWFKIKNCLDENSGYNLYPIPYNLIGYKYSKEIIDARKKRNAENGCYWTGKKHSIETKRKISESHIGKVKSEEHKKNIRTARTGTKHLDSSKKLISDNTKGEKNPRAILNNILVIEIRNKYENMNISVIDLSKEYCVSWSCIDKIVKYRNWKNV